MLRICLLALIGIPAAGKTYFSRWLGEQSETKCNVLHLCYDDYLSAPNSANTTECFYKNERLEIFKVLVTIIETLKSAQSLPLNLRINIAKIEKSSDYLIICDENHYYRSMRHALYKLCRKHQLNYAQLYFECDLDTALARNSERVEAARIPNKIIEQMFKRLEPPSAVSHFWEQTTFVQRTNLPLIASDILNFLDVAFEQPLPITNVSQQVTKQSQANNQAHQLDLLLRQRIAQLLQVLTHAEEKRAQVLYLNGKRKEILMQFKMNASGNVPTEDLSRYLDMLQ